MPITIMGPTASTYPTDEPFVGVDVKRHWSDDWLFTPELRVLRAHWSVGGYGIDQAEIRYEYAAAVKHPWQTGFAAYPPIDLMGWWVRLWILSAQGVQVVLTGRVGDEARDLEGTEQMASGLQTWIVYGPLWLLERIRLNSSYWLVGTAEKELGWLPGMNDRDQRKMLIGNRSLAVGPAGVYLYGGWDTWTHRQYVEYLLGKFADESASNGPSWSLGGQADILEGFQSVRMIEAATSIGDLLRDLIPPSRGVDFKITRTSSGFEVSVYALAASAYSYLGTTIPQNQQLVQITVGETLDNIRTQVARSNQQGYREIRVRGRRAVVCCSLGGDDCPIPEIAGTLARMWSTALEAAYETGGGGLGQDADSARHDERFRNVFAAFAAPVDWDKASHGVTVAFDHDGEFQPGETADYQVTAGSTLRWTPLREGYDYSLDPAQDANPADYSAEFLPPAAWVCNPLIPNWATGLERYYRADEVGIAVSVLTEDWGVLLTAHPQHLLGLGTFDGQSDHLPLFDYRYNVVTLAFEADQRQTITLESPDAKPSDGVLEVEVEDAEFWLLAPRTVVGVNADGILKQSGAEPRVLRDDRARLAQALAGILARYQSARIRAEIQIVGCQPWQALLGCILTCLETGGLSAWLEAPITSIDWFLPDDADQEAGLTVIRAGFAR